MKKILDYLLEKIGFLTGASALVLMRSMYMGLTLAEEKGGISLARVPDAFGLYAINAVLCFAAISAYLLLAKNRGKAAKVVLFVSMACLLHILAVGMLFLTYFESGRLFAIYMDVVADTLLGMGVVVFPPMFGLVFLLSRLIKNRYAGIKMLAMPLVDYAVEFFSTLFQGGISTVYDVIPYAYFSDFLPESVFPIIVCVATVSMFIILPMFAAKRES